MKRIQVIDSHTGGEPTRIVVGGGPDLGSVSLFERRALLAEKHDDLRTAVVNEPRGSDVLVGGLLCEPVNPECAAGIIFFDTAGYLGMCGHGTIGTVVTLQHMGRIEKGHHRIETPIGEVAIQLADDNRVTVQNVPSYRLHESVAVVVPTVGKVIGDVAWGGNWFFLIKQIETEQRLEPDNVDQLMHVTKLIRTALYQQGIRGHDEAPVDHIEIYAEPKDPENNSRNFVLCPSGQYDRSPCGTGTSAKLACLAADGLLQPGETWRQESIIGSVFECSYQAAEDGKIIPTLSGQAHVSGEATLLLDPNDPFCTGIKSCQNT